MSPLLRLLRPDQWVKNAFVLAPLVFAGLFLESAALLSALTAVLFFCVAASMVYVFNDLHDIERDRAHPVKSKSRPLASGEVTPSQARGLLLGLGAIIVAGFFWHAGVMLVIAAYLLLNVAYTYYLKDQPVIEIFVIAIGFVLRVYAGATALSVSVSSWMFATTLCLALYLAAVKRRQELLHSGSDGREVLRHYTVSLVDRYAEMSATGALLFYALFVVTARPELTGTIPLVIFGLFRYWFLVESHDEGESPTDALLHDWQLLGTALVWVAVSGWTVVTKGF